MLDTKIIDLVRQGDPSQAGSVPGFIANKTLREAMNMPMIGGQVAATAKQHLGKAGITPQQFDQAVKEGPPKPSATAGKRSEAPVVPEQMQKVRYAAADTGTMTDAGPELPDDARPQELGQAPTPSREQGQGQPPPQEQGQGQPPPQERGQGQPPPQELGQMTPGIAQALQGVFQGEAAPPMAPIPAEAMPVLPVQPEGPMGLGAGGGAGGLSLAPAGLSSVPTGALNTGALPSQGGSIAMAGMLPPIENATYSSPLLDSSAVNTGSAFGAGNLSPIPWETLGGWGWGGGGGGGFDFGGGSGFDFGSGMSFGGFD